MWFSLVQESFWITIAEKQHFRPFPDPKIGVWGSQDLTDLIQLTEMTPKYTNLYVKPIYIQFLLVWESFWVTIAEKTDLDHFGSQSWGFRVLGSYYFYVMV